MSSSGPPPPAKGSWTAKIVALGGVAFVSAVDAKLQSPQGQESLYVVIGLAASLLGFGAMWAISKWTTRQLVLIVWAAAFLVLAIIFITSFRWLLHSPYETSPSAAIEVVEAILYSAWAFCLFAVVCAPYRIGGDDLIEAFEKIRKILRL